MPLGGGGRKSQRKIGKDKFDRLSRFHLKGRDPMKEKELHDLVGIGIGPFGLGLAALLDPVNDVDAVFFEQSREFEWHPGMLIDGTDLQVPYLADLVTFADPRSRYSFVNYLHEQNRLYQFFFFNRFDIPRKEYNDYAKWVASNLKHGVFGKRVMDVVSRGSENPYYEVEVLDIESGEIERVYARHVVLGTGSIPNVPEPFSGLPESDVIHSSDYLFREEAFKKAEDITVIGSGQSAAEIFYDLLEHQKYADYHLSWYTRSAGFFQLESAKLGQEVFSPDYVNYFRSLDFDTRINTLPTLGTLRKGMDPETLKRIYHLLYHRSIHRDDPPVVIQPLTELNEIEKNDAGNYILSFRQWQEDRAFEIETNKVVLATGYKPNIPDWLARMKGDIEWEDDKRFKVLDDYRIAFHEERPHHLFTLTNLEHADGAGATNLGLSVQRNQKIINKVAGRVVYPLRDNTVFQRFSSKSKTQNE
jgi:lysine N6-hydroxylase